MAKGSQSSTVPKPVAGPSSTKSDVSQCFCMYVSVLVRVQMVGFHSSVLHGFRTAFCLST